MGSSRGNSRSSSRRPSLSGVPGQSSRRASFDSTHSDGIRGDAFGGSVALPMDRENNSSRGTDGGSSMPLNRGPRDSVLIDKEVWLSAMGELSGDKINLASKKSSRKLSVAAVAGLPMAESTKMQEDKGSCDLFGNESPESKKTHVDSFLEKVRLAHVITSM